MLKKFLTILAMMCMSASFAATEINSASAADLEGIKGIGSAYSSKIIAEREKGKFKDWNDLIERVPGIGEKNSAQFSSSGLTVNGAAYKGAPGAKAAKKQTASKDKKTQKAKGDENPAKASKTKKEKEKKDNPKT